MFRQQPDRYFFQVSDGWAENHAQKSFQTVGGGGKITANKVLAPHTIELCVNRFQGLEQEIILWNKVKVGDIITHINNKPLNISTYKEIFDSIKQMKAGDICQLDILRNGEIITVEQELYHKMDRNVFEFDTNVSDKIISMRNRAFKNNFN